MAWTAPATATVGQVLTAAFLNTNLRDNLNYLKGGSSAVVATSQTTASTTYADLATVGPAVTLATDTQALVMLFCNLSNTLASTSSIMGFAVSEATTIVAADSQAMSAAGAAATGFAIGASFLITGLTPGSNIFTAKYRVGAGTGTFQNRRLAVMPQ